MKIKKISSLIITATILSGCNMAVSEEATISQIDEKVQQIIEQAAISEPAPIYEAVNVSEKSISLILEGMADEGAMMALADILAQEKIEAIMFIPAVEGRENPDLIKYINNKGIEIGNYGLTGEEDLGASPDTKIARQIYVSNGYFKDITWNAPDYFYATRSEYTETMLKIATAVGLDGVVEPNIFLNYKSFTDKEMALDYTTNDLRGDIVSIKLTGELNNEEAPSSSEKDETPAVDKQPTIDIATEEIIEASPTVSVVDVVTWFIEGCRVNQINILSLSKLNEGNIIIDQVEALEEELSDPIHILRYRTASSFYEAVMN